ncbi:MAG: hypothetical protein AAF909_13870 [Pseudomonadota bacterium]
MLKLLAGDHRCDIKTGALKRRRTGPNRWIAGFITISLAIAFSAFAGPSAAAHPGDHGGDLISTRLYSLPGDEDALVLEIDNNTDVEVTLTELRAPGSKRIALERGGAALGPISLSPGETVRLGAPEGRLAMDAETRGFLTGQGGGLTAVFRPFGPVVVLYEAPDSVFADPDL